MTCLLTNRSSLKKAWAVVFSSLLITNSLAQEVSGVWFVRAGANGDGTTIENPLGSVATLETMSQPSDIIIILPGDFALDGGIALKTGQTITGLSRADQKPIITNSIPDRNGGNGLILAGDNKIENIRIENTFASGILGMNVSDCWIDDVEIVHANQSRTSMDIPNGGPNGGIMLGHLDSAISSRNHITNTSIIDAIGPGIASVSFNASKDLLSVHNCLIQGGSFVDVRPRIDCGILIAAQGENTKSILEVSDSKISGRMSPHGRNIIVAAHAKASAKARIVRTYSGEVGQDGILGTVRFSPAEVNIDIENSILEKATTNLEGTIGNFPPADSLRASEAKVSIHVKESIIRDAISNMEWEGEKVGAGNIILGPSPSFPSAPMPPGTYELSIMNSRIENGAGYGFYIGIMSSEFKCKPDILGVHNVILRDNVIKNSGESAFIISAANANIDARQNCWGSKEGLDLKKVLIGDNSSFSQLDKSDPVRCASEK